MEKVRFDFERVFNDVVGQYGIGRDELESTLDKLVDCYRDLVRRHEENELGFMKLPYENFSHLERIASIMRERYSQLILVGIGGSSLGVEAVLNAIFYRQNSNFVVFDNVDPIKFDRLIRHIDFVNACIVVVSKSGTTLETIANFNLIYRIFENVFKEDFSDRIVVITDPVKGPLRKFALSKGLKCFDVPPNVGGRFSVLSAVGIFPFYFMGLDVDSMLKGAKSAITELEGVNKKHPSFMLAAIYYLLYKKGMNINVYMTYIESMEKFVDWFRQLWAESLGKDGKGQTPVKAIGTVDQHSQIQLYNDGPRDKVVTFIVPERSLVDFTIRDPLLEDFKYLNGKSLGNILVASYEGTRDAMTERGIPNATLYLSNIDEEVFGYLFMVYEIAVALSGYLYGVNPFDQPGVERGKEITRSRLSI
ncbi:MAG: glucose-6-phosphate isomerase [Thermosulfidibacteraceae bacterium]|jgi:glucose-6-phosphate isomerase